MRLKAGAAGAGGFPWRRHRRCSLLRQLVIPSSEVLQATLDEFRGYYNHVRPHQNLQGLTPAEHFAGLRPVDLQQMPIKQATPVQALAGLMRGYWVRR